MTRHGFHTGIAVLLLSAGSICSGAAAQSGSAVDFREVYELIRTNAAGVLEADLNRAAVRGLIDQLKNQVSIVGEDNPEAARSTEPALARGEIFSENLAYFRVGRIADGLAEELHEKLRKLQSTNRLIGMVLDLRYATGTDYPAAAEVADLFYSNAVPLLDFGQGVVNAQAKTNWIRMPLAILVNGQTAGAAEALAGVLRAHATGLILGSTTAGNAMVTREFPLSNGDRLRVATGPIVVGDGTRVPVDGIKPDVSVHVSAESERAYYADSFYVAPGTNLVADAGGSQTNGAALRRTRLNEADLVREHREGNSRFTNTPPQLRPEEPSVPVVSDPALARALDLLKGLAVVRQSRS